jgi:AcrR family transcriptional regulator
MEIAESKISYHHGDLKRALLEKSERLLEESGIAGLSLRNVAREAGVSHTAPYRHFRDKTGLLSALAQVGFERLAEGMHLARRSHPNDPMLQLRDAGITYVKLAVDHPEMTNLMFGGMLKADQDPDLQIACDAAFEALVAIVKNGQNAGIYKPRDTMDLALAAWAAVHGLAMLITGGKLTEATKREIPVGDLTETVGELLLLGMLN